MAVYVDISVAIFFTYYIVLSVKNKYTIPYHIISYISLQAIINMQSLQEGSKLESKDNIHGSQSKKKKKKKKSNLLLLLLEVDMFSLYFNLSMFLMAISTFIYRFVQDLFQLSLRDRSQLSTFMKAYTAYAF